MLAVSAAPLVWMVDDAPEWHLVTTQTLGGGSYRLEHFHSGNGALIAFQERALHEPEQLPDVILLDFYLGDMRGDAVCQALRELEDGAHRAVIVGFSSVASCSARIVAAGGDLALRKGQDADGRNPLLLRWLAQWSRRHG